MKSISVHVTEADYQELKSLAATMERPVAELIREAMARYLSEQQRGAHSLADVAPHPSGRQLGSWTRAELFEEMSGR